MAAGVAKAYADYIHIAGHSGGTGASPLSSIKHAGNPWELGLAEAQQVLRHNGLRGRVRLRVDGGITTARDVLVAAMLGADEFSFGTAVLLRTARRPSWETLRYTVLPPAGCSRQAARANALPFVIPEPPRWWREWANTAAST